MGQGRRVDGGRGAPGSGRDGCVPLATLRPGTRVRLCDHPDRVTSQRLLDLGFVPNTPLTVLRVAPLGDPIEVELRGYHLCLRRDDVRLLCVAPERTDPSTQ